MSKNLEQAVDELKDTSIKMTEHMNFLKEDFSEIKVELKSITRILEKQVEHETKLNSIQDQIKPMQACHVDSGIREQKILEVDKKVEKLSANLNKVVFVLFGAIVAVALKFVFLHNVTLSTPVAG